MKALVLPLSPTGLIAKAIADYTGREVVEVECVPDPKIAGTYAYRATLLADGPLRAVPEQLQFLTVGVSLHKVTYADLEEVEFESWPPESGTKASFAAASLIVREV
jgi:hypothetical protein